MLGSVYTPYNKILETIFGAFEDCSELYDFNGFFFNSTLGCCSVPESLDSSQLLITQGFCPER